jgi:dihydrofolate reductase
VFTSSTLDQEWAHTAVADASPEEYVADLRQQPGGDIGVHGSIQLARTLLRAGLVDELRLVVAPAVANGGKRLFEEGEGLQKLELVDSDRTTDGALLLGYRTASAG